LGCFSKIRFREDVLIFERDGQKRSNNFKNYKSLLRKQRSMHYLLVVFVDGKCIIGNIFSIKALRFQDAIGNA